MCAEVDSVQERRQMHKRYEVHPWHCKYFEGAGSDQFVDAEVLLAPSRTVLMSPDVKVAKNRRRHIERQIVLVLDQSILEFPKESELPSFWKDLAGGFGASPVGVDIYADGAWDKKTGTIKDVFHYFPKIRTLPPSGKNWQVASVQAQ